MVPVVPGRGARPARAGRARRGVRRAGAALRAGSTARSPRAWATASRWPRRCSASCCWRRASRARGSSVLAESAGRPGFVRAAARLVGRARAGAGGPGALHAGAAGVGGGRAAAAPTRTRWPPIYAGYRARARARRGSWTPSCSRGARSTRCGSSPPRWGGDPGVRLRVRRLHRARARRAGDAARAAAARTSCVSLPFEPGQGGLQGHGGGARPPVRAGRGAHRAGRRGRPLRGRRRAPRSTRWSAALFEADPPAPVDAGDAIAFHSAGGARAEVELAAARVLELLRGGTAPGDVAVVFRDPAPLLDARGAGVRRLRRALLARPLAAVRPHRARPRAARADPLRRRRAAAPTTSSPTCALPGS